MNWHFICVQLYMDLVKSVTCSCPVWAERLMALPVSSTVSVQKQQLLS